MLCGDECHNSSGTAAGGHHILNCLGTKLSRWQHLRLVMASVNPGRRNIHTHSGTAIHLPPSPPPRLCYLRLYNEISKSSAKIAECRKTPVPRFLVGKQVGRHPLLPERREARSHTPESTQCPGAFVQELRHLRSPHCPSLLSLTASPTPRLSKAALSAGRGHLCARRGFA